MSKRIAVYIKTKNDINGNPRRGWLIYKSTDNLQDGCFAAFVNEGYHGKSWIRTVCPDVVVLTGIEIDAIDVTPSFFRKAKKLEI